MNNVQPIRAAGHQLWFIGDDNIDGDSRDLMIGAGTMAEAIGIWRKRWLTNETPRHVWRVNATTPVHGALHWHRPNCELVHEVA
jgi:type IV secretory pathway TrbD component